MSYPAPLTLQQTVYKGWSAWLIHNGPLELLVVPQVGGRVMGMRWHGHELAFTQPERHGYVEQLSDVQNIHTKKRAIGFPLWGGDKTWLAPQDRWTDGVPFLDLDSGAYDLHVEQADSERVMLRMTSPVCRETGVQITRTLTVIAGTAEWQVKHHLSNASQEEIEWGPWAVSMVLKPGKVYLPRNPHSVFPNGVKTFTGEGESIHVRKSVVSELGTLAVIRCEEPHAFKFGVDGREGWMLGIVEIPGQGLVGYRTQVPAPAMCSYGHGCTAEVYNSDRYPYLEMEMHGPLVRLKPGESYALEQWHALCTISDWPSSEEEVRNLPPHIPRKIK